MQLSDLYERKILIATKHKKELVIAPILEENFKMIAVTSFDFDSDEFGTFTGEIERSLGPIETIKLKAKNALEATEFDLVIASEGSFGPHPYLFFSPCDEEFLYLYDKKNDFEILVKSLTTITNFNSQEILSQQEFEAFLSEVNFPSHGVILKDIETNSFYKEINEESELKSVFQNLLYKNGKVPCETDMRAMFNPTRMQHIKELTKKLVEEIQLICPKCLHPGFQITEAKKGLPCESCHFPTESTLAYISECQACNYKEEKLFPKNKKYEEAMYCNFCNP
ncbi:MAG: DUF6671 family protein [Flavobacteriia bacterium]